MSTLRDARGRFLPKCRALPGCTEVARYGIEGYGWYGLRHATSARFCRVHGRAQVEHMKRGRRSYGSTYKLVKVP